MYIGPKATMFDGRLDFTLVPQLGIPKQLIAIPRLYKGTIGGFPGITVCHGQTIRATPQLLGILAGECRKKGATHSP